MSKIESITATVQWDLPYRVEWKHIPGYENLYMVSNLGEVLRLPRIQENLLTGGKSIFPSCILKQRKTKAGYKQIVLYRPGEEGKTWLVHRLLAKAFLGAEDGDGRVVDHIDGNKENNRIDNLELITPKENTARAIALGLRRARKITEEDIAEIVRLRKQGMLRRDIAKKFHVHEGTIDNWLIEEKEGRLKWVEL